jgi:hypothetical protein
MWASVTVLTGNPEELVRSGALAAILFSIGHEITSLGHSVALLGTSRFGIRKLVPEGSGIESRDDTSVFTFTIVPMFSEDTFAFTVLKN